MDRVIQQNIIDLGERCLPLLDKAIKDGYAQLKRSRERRERRESGANNNR